MSKARRIQARSDRRQSHSRPHATWISHWAAKTHRRNFKSTMSTTSMMKSWLILTLRGGCLRSKISRKAPQLSTTRLLNSTSSRQTGSTIGSSRNSLTSSIRQDSHPRFFSWSQTTSRCNWSQSWWNNERSTRLMHRRELFLIGDSRLTMSISTLIEDRRTILSVVKLKTSIIWTPSDRLLKWRGCCARGHTGLSTGIARRWS